MLERSTPRQCGSRAWSGDTIVTKVHRSNMRSTNLNRTLKIRAGITGHGPYFRGSFTLTTPSAATLVSCWTIPEGQRISASSTDLARPNPKCVGLALDDA